MYGCMLALSSKELATTSKVLRMTSLHLEGIRYSVGEKVGVLICLKEKGVFPSEIRDS